MNLMEGLLKEIDRVTELKAEYESLPNNAGFFGASLMKVSLANAKKVIAEGDTIGMMTAYKDLEEITG